MRATILVLVLLTMGCEWFQEKPAVVRCETVTPPVPKERQAKIDELTDLSLNIDLAIAREDWSNVEGAESGYEGARKLYHDAQDQKLAPQKVNELFKGVMEENERLDKALEVAAGHRHH